MKNWRDDKEALAAAPQAGQLCLYVAGKRAQLAEANVRRCCDEYFAGQYRLHVVDLQQHPEVARREQLLALPVLVRQQPAPKRYLVGTLIDEAKLLASLALSEDC